MTTTEQDLRALHYLAKRIRQDLNGATEWDDQGVWAILRKIQGRRLADVALAVIRAADDRTAKTPGVLVAPDSLHWRERSTVEQTGAPRRSWDRGTHCGTCSEPQHICEARDGDHEFEPAAKAALHAVPKMPNNVRPLLPRPAKDRREVVPGARSDRTE